MTFAIDHLMHHAILHKQTMNKLSYNEAAPRNPVLLFIYVKIVMYSNTHEKEDKIHVQE